MNRLVASVTRKCELGKYVHHSKPKPLYSFIKSRQATLQDFAILLANLIVNCLFRLELQKSTTYEPLIAWFLKKLSNAFRHPKFHACHEKYQGKYSWLAHHHIKFLRQFLTLLAEVSLCFASMGILVAGKTLTADKCDPVIKLMGKAIARINRSAQANKIGPLERALASC